MLEGQLDRRGGAVATITGSGGSEGSEEDSGGFRC